MSLSTEKKAASCFIPKHYRSFRFTSLILNAKNKAPNLGAFYFIQDYSTHCMISSNSFRDFLVISRER